MHNFSGFMKGMATGIVVGTAVTMIADMSDRDKRKIVKKTEGVFKNVGSVIDTAMDMMK